MGDLPSSQMALVATLLVVALVWFYYARRTWRVSTIKLPPGPRGIPILGSLLQVPRSHLATYFRSLLKEYGGLVYLNLSGFPIVLIGDIALAKEVLEKHGAKHSSRPHVPYFHRYIDLTGTFWAAAPEGKTLSIARKLTGGVMSSVRAGKTEQLQTFEALFNIQKLLDDGGKGWYHHMERVTVSTTLSIIYGLHFPTGQEPDLKEVLQLMTEGLELASPLGSIINAFPFLDWIPGPMPWRVRAQSFRARENALYKKLVEEATTGKGAGMNTWAAAFASKDKPEGDQSRLLNQIVPAGIETTTSALQSFVLACIRYPQWIPFAQREIDKIVGNDRLPTFKDRPFLPYVEAVVRETLRWRPAVRFGLPHFSTADDIVLHQGVEYVIPKGTLVFAVTWAIEHDEAKFELPDQFMPERFLDAGGQLKAGYGTSAFGFGRRVCPGAPLAERSLWINIACMIWAFDIHGSDEVDPTTGARFVYDDSDAAFNGSFTNSPFNFPAVFTTRSSHRAEVARREWLECEKDLNILLPASKR